jgi:hypothetical protein
MKKKIRVIAISLIVLSLVVWTIVHFSVSNNYISQTKSIILYDSSKQEFMIRKKELMLKDYDSLFSTLDRETVIVNNFRGWAITLLVLCLTAFITLKSLNSKLVYQAGIFIITSFYILEVTERHVMLNLVQELRNFESIFDIQKTNDFNSEIINYEFRDIRDASKSLWNKNIINAVSDPKVIWWNAFLIFFYLFLVRNIRKK